MTSSLYSDGPPLTSSLSSPPCGHPIDTTLALSSLSYVIHQLSTLLLHAGPPLTNSSLSLFPLPPTLTHSWLVGSLSNVLHTSLQLVSASSPPIPVSSFSSLPADALSTSTPSPPTHVTSLHSSPSPASDAAHLPLSLPLASESSSSISPSPSANVVSATVSRHTIRVLTEIQTLPVQPSLFSITNVKRNPTRGPTNTRPQSLSRRPSSASPSRAHPHQHPQQHSSCLPHSANPFAVLSQNPTTKPTTPRPRRHSLPSSCSPPQATSLASEPTLQATQPQSKATTELTCQSPAELHSSTENTTPNSFITIDLTQDIPITESTAALLSISRGVTSPPSTFPSSPPSSASLPSNAGFLVSGEEQAAQSLDTLRTQCTSTTTFTNASVDLDLDDDSGDVTASTTHDITPSSSPSLSLTCAEDGRSVDALQATYSVSKATASPSPTPDSAAVISKPIEDIANTTTLTSTTTSAVAAAIPSDFHSRLHTRLHAHAQYFHHHFLPSSPLCECKLFPVYSSKLGQPPSACKLAAVNDLCLDCIASILNWEYGTEPPIWEVFLTDELWGEWVDYYSGFYTEEEQTVINLWESDEERFLCFNRSMERIMPWLSKRGVRRTCPHVAGTCRDICCCRGTEEVAALADAEEEVSGIVKREETEAEGQVDAGKKEKSSTSTARLVIGKRKKKKKGKQGKWMATWASK
jgi:hypothetical protein